MVDPITVKAGMSFLKSKTFLYIVIAALIFLIILMIITVQKCTNKDSVLYKIKEKWWGWIPPLIVPKLILIFLCPDCPAK